MTVLFNFFMKQRLIIDFWGLHKNLNCAFPGNQFLPFNNKYHKCADRLFLLRHFYFYENMFIMYCLLTNLFDIFVLPGFLSSNKHGM